jgi:hypothetical protein
VADDAAGVQRVEVINHDAGRRIRRRAPGEPSSSRCSLTTAPPGVIASIIRRSSVAPGPGCTYVSWQVTAGTGVRTYVRVAQSGRVPLSEDHVRVVSIGRRRVELEQRAYLDRTCSRTDHHRRRVGEQEKVECKQSSQ